MGTVAFTFFAVLFSGGICVLCFIPESSGEEKGKLLPIFHATS